VAVQYKFTYEQSQNRRVLVLSAAGRKFPSRKDDLEKLPILPFLSSDSSRPDVPLLTFSSVAGGALYATWTDSGSTIKAFMGVKASVSFGSSSFDGEGRLQLEIRNGETERMRGFLDLSVDVTSSSLSVTSSVKVHVSYWKTRLVSQAQLELENRDQWLQDQHAALEITAGPEDDEEDPDWESEEEEQEGEEENPAGEEPLEVPEKDVPEEDVPVSSGKDGERSPPKEKEQAVVMLRIKAGVSISLAQLQRIAGDSVKTSLATVERGSANALELSILVHQLNIKFQMQGTVAVLQNLFLECEAQLNMNMLGGSGGLLNVTVTLCFTKGQQTFLCVEPKVHMSGVSHRGAGIFSARTKLVFLDGVLCYASISFEGAGVVRN
jgi:hypothetical protein